MPLWYRVFGRSRTPVEPAVVREFLRTLYVPGSAEFEPDSGDWLSATVRLGEREIDIERFPAEEEGIRAELNTWAAFLETCDHSPNNVPLMEHVIQTSQLFTVRPADVDDEAAVENLCRELAGLLARATDGVYQVDDEGFFQADGRLILPAS